MISTGQAYEKRMSICKITSCKWYFIILSNLHQPVCAIWKNFKILLGGRYAQGREGGRGLWIATLPKKLANMASPEGKLVKHHHCNTYFSPMIWTSTPDLKRNPHHFPQNKHISKESRALTETSIHTEMNYVVEFPWSWFEKDQTKNCNTTNIMILITNITHHGWDFIHCITEVNHRKAPCYPPQVV